MGKWISSKEFAEKYGINVFTIYKLAKRANQKGKKFCKFIGKIFPISYKNNLRGGNAGKVLQIWNTPLSQKQVEALEKGYPIKYVLEEMGEVVETPRVYESMDCSLQSPFKEVVARSSVWEVTHSCSENVCALNKRAGQKESVESTDKTIQPNVRESKDSKALVCKENTMEEKEANHEKTLKENSREALHTRGDNEVCRGSRADEKSPYSL